MNQEISGKRNTFFYPRAWIYLRCQTEEQAVQQKLAMLTAAQNQGYDPLGIGIDIGRADCFWRPAFRRLIRQIRKESIDIVLVPRLSAIDTRQRKLVRFLRLAQKHQVVVQTVERNLSDDLCRHGLDTIVSG